MIENGGAAVADTGGSNAWVANGSSRWRVLCRASVIVPAVALLVILVAGALAPRLAPQGWNWIDLSSRWQSHGPTFGADHFFGTDNIGRDVLARTLYGIRTSEVTALLAATLALMTGLTLGSLAGVLGGVADAALMRVADLTLSLPALFVLYAAFVFLDPVTITKAAALIGFYASAYVARVVRNELLHLKRAEFVEAARACGAGELRILRSHLLPNVTGALVIATTALLAQAVMLEATVEFFGLGVSSQVEPSLGNLIGDATSSGIGPFNDLGLGWWVWASPALALTAIILSANFLGDAIDAALAPTTRRL